MERQRNEQGWTHGEIERDAGVSARERLSPGRGHGAQRHVRVCAGGQLLKRFFLLPGRRWTDVEPIFWFFLLLFIYSKEFLLTEPENYLKTALNLRFAKAKKSLSRRDHTVTSQKAYVNSPPKDGVSQKCKKDGKSVEKKWLTE